MSHQEGPSLHEFMAQDTSFLSQLQRSEGDDYIEYRIYSDRTREGTDVLEEVRAAIMAMASVLLKDHIWHREGFALEVVQGQSGHGGNHEAYLWGHTRVGENVEDEWVITYLLHTATAHPSLASYGLSAYVTDADGHFLLIEAACELPDWLTPDCSDFRVWMRGGGFHVLSPGHHPAPIDHADVALSLLRAPPSIQHQPTAAPWLDAALRPRFCLYPGAIQEQGHHACCLVPVSLAYALEHHPQLVANAARAFRLRDSSAMGTLNARGQTWRFSPSKCVQTRVRFSRYLYGQLQADEDVCPPRDFVAAVDTAGGLNARGVALGLKLACGAELAYRQHKGGYDERREEQRHRFMRRMEAMGVFVGLAAGSKARKDKERIVRSEFEKTWSERHGANGEGEQAKSLHTVVDALLAGGFDEEKEYQTRRKTEVPPDDDESWLEVSPDQLESLLRRYAEEEGQGGPAPKESAGKAGSDEEEDEESEGGEGVEEIEELLRGMKAFMGTKSGVEGAELPGDKGDGLEDLDVDRLMRILRGEAVEGKEEWMDEDSGGSDDSDDSEDDMEGDDRFSDEEEEEAAGRGVEGGRVRVREVDGPDSDDEDEDEEEEEEEERLQDYMAAMDQELTGSTMFQSFERMPAPAPTHKEGGQASQANEASAALGPVNLDLNLVKSLLDSVAMQGAEPGPVSTLLNEMARLQKG